MAADSWLESELADLDEAEKFIQQTMSDFIPSGSSIPESHSSTNYAAKPVGNRKVTNSLPKSPPEVDKYTNQLISDLRSDKKPAQNGSDQFHLPPPPEVDDLLAYQKRDRVQKSNNYPPPPSSYSLPPNSTQTKYSVMSKAPPPPVFPKPSKSTPVQVKTGIGSVTMQINNPKSPRSPSKTPQYDPAPSPTPPLANHYQSQSSFPPPPPQFEPINDLPLPPPPVAPISPKKSTPSRGIPKGIEKNSVDELDFLTNNLLLNMENPKDEDFYGYCEKCGGVVEGENVGCNAMDKIYHISCFVCATPTCGIKLHGDPFYSVDKKPYCESCYMATLEKCTVCSQVITERILRATGKPFHPSCFKCGVCGRALDGVPFTTDDSNNVYCVECYHQKFAFRCSVCQGAILPEPGKAEAVRIVAMDKNYHVECYKCEGCEVKFSADEKCYPIDSNIYCLNCNTNRLQKLTA